MMLVKIMLCQIIKGHTKNLGFRLYWWKFVAFTYSIKQQKNLRIKQLNNENLIFPIRLNWQTLNSYWVYTRDGKLWFEFTTPWRKRVKTTFIWKAEICFLKVENPKKIYKKIIFWKTKYHLVSVVFLANSESMLGTQNQK